VTSFDLSFSDIKIFNTANSSLPQTAIKKMNKGEMSAITIATP
jgi:hypothetical protein